VSNDCLKSEWIYHCLRLMGRPSDLYPHGRKILRDQRLTFDLWDDSLKMDDLGFTNKKMADLQRLYKHDESRAVAIELWQERRPDKLKSVAFHCFAHDRKRAGVNGEQGPCLNSVTVTGLPDGQVAVNVAYRSIVFPADLAFLHDDLLKPFGPIDKVTCDVANVTVHPLRFVNLLPHLPDPVGELKKLRQLDPRFHDAVNRDAEDLLCGGTANKNFMSAQRMLRFVRERTDPKILKEVIAYVSA
jgi:hypothetical protein